MVSAIVRDPHLIPDSFADCNAVNLALGYLQGRLHERILNLACGEEGDLPVHDFQPLPRRYDSERAPAVRGMGPFTEAPAGHQLARHTRVFVH